VAQTNADLDPYSPLTARLHEVHPKMCVSVALLKCGHLPVSFSKPTLVRSGPRPTKTSYRYIPLVPL